VLCVLTGCGVSEVVDPPEASLAPAPRMATRRLNRSEYDRTVRDLLGTAQTPARQFPADDATDGFDVVADGLVVSSLHVELFDQAAASLAAEIVDRPLAGPIDLTLQAEGEGFTSDAAYGGPTADAFGLYARGTLETVVEVPKAGRYLLSVRAWAEQAGDAVAHVTLGVDGVGGADQAIPGTSTADATWGSVELELPRGRAHVQVVYQDDFVDELTGEDRNVFVDAVRLEGPLDFVYTPNPAYERVMICDPESDADPRACVRRVLESFTPRAWRRPVESSEIDGLMAVADAVLDAGDPPQWAAEFALRTVLASPWFVLHVEPAPPDTDAPVPVDDWTLAARLATFLWSSMPDEELSAHAAAGDLQDPQVLRAQVTRMLQDPKASALADDLAGQWLMIRALSDVSPDFATFPFFVEATRASMRESMRLTFMDLVTQPRPMTDLLLGSEVWVDDTVAELYGMLPRGWTDFHRVDLTGYDRPGWLGLPGLLTATSYPTRTSPVKRGVWVLDNLLCDATAAPPANVGAFPEPSASASTVRERLEAHRNSPVCAGCHDRIDPIGLAMEGFDGIGRSRDRDAGEPIDATGQLPDGTQVDGAMELAAALADDERFERCVVKKVFTYAHGRAPADDEGPRVERLVSRFQDDGATLEALVSAIVLDDAFRSHGGRP
jgi:hypothetical protein